MKNVVVFTGRNRLVRIGLLIAVDMITEELHGINRFQHTDRWEDLSMRKDSMDTYIIGMDNALIDGGSCVELPIIGISAIGFAVEYFYGQTFESVPSDVLEALDSIWDLVKRENGGVHDSDEINIVERGIFQKLLDIYPRLVPRDENPWRSPVENLLKD